MKAVEDERLFAVELAASSVEKKTNWGVDGSEKGCKIRGSPGRNVAGLGSGLRL